MTRDESPILAFYAGRGVDHRGRTLEDILRFDNLELETTHDYIQWLFPLTTSSQFNPQAPILSTNEIDAFRSTPELRLSVARSFVRLLEFYGFELLDTSTSPVVRKADAFAQRVSDWRAPGNHNYLRITRILKSLHLLGLPRYANAFLEALEAAYAEDPNRIGERTISFWRSAGETHP